ncbi:MAG: methionine ABC transporter ATP-binding protein [Clostridium sp.]|nr:methionine ABC transporter ATP-binding protein [Clostridium sp.]
MIEMTDIVKTFQAGAKQVDAVKNVSFTIKDGEIFGIIGFSGAGKSTLVRCINLLGRPTSGSVKIDGTDLTQLSPKDLRAERKKIGMIFQHFNLMPSRTVFGNVAFPLKDSGLSKEEIRQKVRRLLELVDLADKENAYPSELSGGQKQRVAIARALANDPKILLSDEATSALDPQTTGAILQLLKKLNREFGITVVVITHEMEVIKEICQRVAVMENGEVVELGDVFSVFANPQHPLTRSFIRTTSNLSKIDQMIADHVPGVTPEIGEVLVKLSYRQKDVSEPLIATAARKFDLDINIILADVEIVAGAPIGGTVVILHGESEQISRAISYMKEKNVGVEVISDARNRY